MFLRRVNVLSQCHIIALKATHRHLLRGSESCATTLPLLNHIPHHIQNLPVAIPRDNRIGIRACAVVSVLLFCDVVPCHLARKVEREGVAVHANRRGIGVRFAFDQYLCLACLVGRTGSGFLKKQKQQTLPLPWGEGWGEGQQKHTHCFVFCVL